MLVSFFWSLCHKQTPPHQTDEIGVQFDDNRDETEAKTFKERYVGLDSSV